MHVWWEGLWCLGCGAGCARGGICLAFSFILLSVRTDGGKIWAGERDVEVGAGCGSGRGVRDGCDRGVEAEHSSVINVQSCKRAPAAKGRRNDSSKAGTIGDLLSKQDRLEPLVK